MTELTTFEELEQSSPRMRRLLRQEELILDVSEAIIGVLEARQISRSELAKRLGKSKSFVSQILDGSRNLTLRTLADVGDALDVRVCVHLPERFSSVPKTVRTPLREWSTPTEMFSGPVRVTGPRGMNAAEAETAA